MSSPVEDEIVSMKFDNTQFKSAATESLGILDKLKNALHLPTSAVSGGLSDISKNVRGFNLNPLVDSASEVGKAFSSMSVVAISAIATIASQATQAGIGLAKSLTISPVASGFAEYGTQLNSIQTIMANTGLEGQKGLDKVNAALDQLNTYSDKTIYNFTEMARNIGTFSAAGVDLDTSTAAIKGIANVAAVSGSNSQQASTAMYQLSQALASGSVKLMDWNSVVNAGMGGKVFKDSIMETARAHGVAIDDMIKQDGSFRDTLQRGWFSADILTETLSKFTGDLSRQQLISMGYTVEQAKQIEKMGQTAQDAATKVKTLPQLVDTLKEAVGSGWTKTFATILGDFNQARTTFTQLSDYFGGIVGASADARNQMLSDWAALKGRAVMIKAVRHAWEALMSILGPIKDAFREIFPPTTGKQLFELTQAVNHFFKALVLSKDAQENLKRTFAGFFAVIHIGFSIIKGIVSVLGRLIGLFLEGQGGTLALTGSLGDLLVALDKFLTGGGRMEKFFTTLGDILVGIIGPILDLRTALIEAFLGLVTGDPSRMFQGLNDAISTTLGFVDMLSDKVATAINAISDAFGGLGHIQGLDLAGLFGGGAGADVGAGAAAGVDKVKNSLSGIAGIMDRLHTAWTSFMDGLRGVDTSGVTSAGNEVKSVWDKIFGILHDIGDFLQPLFSQFKNVFGTIGDLLSSAFSGQGLDFSDFLDAVNTGLFLAIFLTIRNFSTAISRVSKSASGVLNQVTSNLKTMQNDVRANIIIKIAAALLILAGAVFLLSKTDPKSLGIALGAVTAMLIELVAALKILEKSVGSLSGGAKLTLVASAMVIMAFAIAAMAGAVYLFSKINPDKLAQGLEGVAASLALLTASAAIMSKTGAGANMIGAAAGLLIMSAALVALSGVIKQYSKIDPDQLTNGLVKIAATIAVLAIAMNLMKSGVAGAAGMLVISFALGSLAASLKKFGDMDTSTIVKGLLAVGGMLAVLAIGMNALQTGLLGAAALIVIAYALGKLVVVLQTFGGMDTSTIVKGLLAMIGAIAALALTAVAISAAVPALMALGIALALIGAAVFLAGTGVAAFAVGLALLAHNGGAGFDVFLAIIHKFLEELPKMIDEFGATIDAIARMIGEHAPALIEAGATLIGAMLDGASKVMPKFGNFISKLIETGLKVLVNYYSDLVSAGLDLIYRLLDGLDKGLPKIVDKATDLAIHFIEALGRNAVKFANAGLQAVIDTLNGIADAIRTHRGELAAAGGNIADALVGGITDWIRNAWGNVRDAIISMVKSAGASAKGAVKGALSAATGGLLREMQGAVDPLTGSFLKLVGGMESVKDGLSSIQEQIKSTLDKSKGDIDKWQKKVDSLKAHGGSKEDIEHAQKMLHAANKLHDQAEAADKHYNKIMKKRGDDLRSLAKQYDDIQTQIAAAQKTLDDAEDKVKSFKEGVMSTFADIPAPEAGQSLNSYMRELQKQTEKVIKFKQMLAAAQGLGLDPKQVEWFLAQGLDASKILEQLLAGGPEAISQFEAAQGNLKDAGQGIADFFSSTLPGYDDAVKVAKDVLQGIIDGVGDKKSLAELEAAMGKIAHIMMKAIRKELQVKSPSRKMMEVGVYAVRGLTDGLDKMHGDVAASSAALGATALDTLQATLSKAGGINSDLSMSPVITPVLDLTQLTRDANSISSLMNVAPLNAAVSFAQASDISASKQAAEGSTDAFGGGDTYIFDKLIEQNNTSPESLDDVTIYRSTKNVISIAKEALGIP